MTADGFALNPAGLFLPSREIVRPKLIQRTGLLMPCQAIEEVWGAFEKKDREIIGKMLQKIAQAKREGISILQMAGSLANFSSKSLQDSLFGKTAFTAAVTIYFGLWTAAIDDTLAGNTASEAAYTSYARLGLTNNTTIFAAGTGTSTYTKTFPSDAAKSFATSTGSTATVTYLGILDGNAGTSADKGYAWCSVTSTTINNGDTPQLAQNAITVVQD